MRILWTKSYNLYHKLGSFKIYVSHHSNGIFFGAVLHYTKTGEWSKGENIELETEFEQFLENTEQKAYQSCLNWVNDNLKGDYKIELDEYKEFEK